MCFLRPTRVHSPNDKSIGSAIFAQLMAVCRTAHWRHLVNMIELVLFSAHPSPQPKQQVSWLSCFCTAHGRKSLYFTIGTPFPKNCPLPWEEDLDPHLIYDSLGHPIPQPKCHLHWFSRFFTDVCRVSLYFAMGRPFSPKNCHFPWRDLDPHLIHGSLHPPESSTQTASRSVFAGLTSVTDRPRDLATRSVAIGHIYVCSTAMQPNKSEQEQMAKKSFDKKAASPPHTGGLIVFARWRHCAPPSNTFFLVPIRVHNPKFMLISSSVFAQLTAKCHGHTRACPFP